MSADQITSEAMALPLAERVVLAQALWASIDTGLSNADSSDEIRQAIERDRELSSGEVVGRTHEQVIDAARRAIGCA